MKTLLIAGALAASLALASCTPAMAASALPDNGAGKFVIVASTLPELVQTADEVYKAKLFTPTEVNEVTALLNDANKNLQGAADAAKAGDGDLFTAELNQALDDEAYAIQVIGTAAQRTTPPAAA